MNELKLDLNEIDYNEGLERFMNKKSSYDKFLLRFKDETSYQEIKDAYDKGDYSSMQESVHALKGLAGNLSLIRVYRITSEMMVNFRSNNIDAIPTLYNDLVAAVNKAIIMLENASE